MDNLLTRRIDVLYQIGNAYKNSKDAEQKRSELVEYLPHISRVYEKITRLNTVLTIYTQITSKTVITTQAKEVMNDIKREVKANVFDKSKVILLENYLDQTDKSINDEWYELVRTQTLNSNGLLETIKNTLSAEQRITINDIKTQINQSSPFSMSGKNAIEHYNNYCKALFDSLKLGTIGEDFFNKLNKYGAVQLKSLSSETLEWLLKSEFASKLYITYKS
jgi:enamine deaminase RidA (YjgF/YER057c/UK114 family)